MPDHNCEKSARPGFLTDGHRQDGERWTCPDCGKVWVHVCDEAEGCSWFPASGRRQSRAARDFRAFGPLATSYPCPKHHLKPKGQAYSITTQGNDGDKPEHG